MGAAFTATKAPSNFLKLERRGHVAVVTNLTEEPVFALQLSWHQRAFDGSPRRLMLAYDQLQSLNSAPVLEPHAKAEFTDQRVHAHPISSIDIDYVVLGDGRTAGDERSELAKKVLARWTAKNLLRTFSPSDVATFLEGKKTGYEGANTDHLAYYMKFYSENQASLDALWVPEDFTYLSTENNKSKARQKKNNRVAGPPPISAYLTCQSPVEGGKTSTRTIILTSAAKKDETFTAATSDATKGYPYPSSTVVVKKGWSTQQFLFKTNQNTTGSRYWVAASISWAYGGYSANTIFIDPTNPNKIDISSVFGNTLCGVSPDRLNRCDWIAGPSNSPWPWFGANNTMGAQCVPGSVVAPPAMIAISLHVWHHCTLTTGQGEIHTGVYEDLTSAPCCPDFNVPCPLEPIPCLGVEAWGTGF